MFVHTKEYLNIKTIRFEFERRNQWVKKILPVHVFPFPVNPFLQVQV